MTSKPFVNEPKNQALCELSHLFAELFNRVLIPPIANIAEEARAIMARDPAVQARVLRAAARHFEECCDNHTGKNAQINGEYDAISCGRCGILADAIEKGDIVLEIPE